MGSNILARNRDIPSLFVTNQFRPKLYSTRSYLYPSAVFISRQIAKATRILVADSPPPYTICEYNLNFTKDVKEKVEYVGHFAASPKPGHAPSSDLERLVEGAEFGYWMRTGDKSTNDGTGQRYEEAFRQDGMEKEKRVISHARDDPSISMVKGTDGRTYSVRDALERKVDWVQIDVGFLSEGEKDTVLERCKYAVVNGSHTVMGEIIGAKSKPVIGMPIYDEHTNNIKWADERNLGVLARGPKGVARAVSRIREGREEFEDSLKEYGRNFVGCGAEASARIAADML